MTAETGTLGWLPWLVSGLETSGGAEAGADGAETSCWDKSGLRAISSCCGLGARLGPSCPGNKDWDQQDPSHPHPGNWCGCRGRLGLGCTGNRSRDQLLFQFPSLVELVRGEELA